MNLAMYELYFRLLGNKRTSTEISESYIRKTLTVTEIILRSLRNTDLSLWTEQGYYLPESTTKILEHGLMTKRTYGSRYRSWRPEKFMKVRIVPVDIQFLNRRKDTEPYSSYCKGYGESHPSAHRKSLKPSAEYDGDGSNYVQAEERKLFLRCTEAQHVLSDFLLIRYSNEEEKGK